MPLLQPHLCMRAGASILQRAQGTGRVFSCQLPETRMPWHCLLVPKRGPKVSIFTANKSLERKEGGPLSTAGLEGYCHETQQAAHPSSPRLMVGQAQLWPTRPPQSIFGKQVSFSSPSINEHSEIFSLLLNRTAEEKENKITLEVTGAERVLLQLL